jgi:nucleotide-binding universal stress UspA family protein
MKVLISIDSLESSKIILSEAYPFLKGFPDAEIHIFTVLDLGSLSVGHGTVDTLLIGDHKHMGEEICRVATEIFGSMPFTFSSEVGYPTDMILQEAEKLRCDLIVMGTHGRTGFDHLIIGSVAAKVLRLAQCNTLVIPMKKHGAK